MSDYYMHYKGDFYEKLYEGTNEKDLEPVVIYQSIRTNEIWVRPLKEWNDPVVYDGRLTTRFEPVSKSLYRRLNIMVKEAIDKVDKQLEEWRKLNEQNL